MPREIRSFDYVNFPYDSVRAVLTEDAPAVFRAATKAASSRARSVAASLHVQIAGIELGKDVDIRVRDVQERAGSGTTPPATRIQLEWEAASAPAFFPIMRADLDVYPLTATETQLDFSGIYEPPLGWFGSAVDAVAGHRIAEASVHRFVSEVAEYLRSQLK